MACRHIDEVTGWKTEGPGFYSLQRREMFPAASNASDRL
jgi:hypothetical protein